jgi:hypothetical protein
VDATSFYNWFDDFLMKGNNGLGATKQGTLEYLSPSLDVLVTLTLRNLGIFKLSGAPSSADRLRKVRAELYCEQLVLQTGASAISEPAAVASGATIQAPTTRTYPSFAVRADTPVAALLPPEVTGTAEWKQRVAGLRFRR